MIKTKYDEVDGKTVYLYTVGNVVVTVDICDFGARINAIRIGGVDVAIGFNSVKDYLESGTYAGATVGRVANRIEGGRFTLNEKPYFLNKNDGYNHLHGGNEGFDKKLFSVIGQTDNSITMTYVSADGEENYSGNLALKVKFTVDCNALTIEFSAVSDKDTLWCPTNHTYINLDGETSGDCRENLLQINSDYYTPVNDGLIPTGEKVRVANSAFDFTAVKAIGKDVGRVELEATKGFDHNFILNGDHAVHTESTVTGIKTDVYTDMPCLQFYSGGQLNGCNGKTGKYYKYAGFCLEPQFCPNAVNMSGFEKPVLKKGEEKKHYIKYVFVYK